MAESAPRMDVPTALNALDDDTYADNTGFPAASALGRQLARNDRCLHANLRRTLVNWAVPIAGDGSPLAAPAGGNWGNRVCLWSGTRLGPWDLPTTPGVINGEWRIRGEWETGGVWYVTPYVEGILPFRGRLVDTAAAYSYTHAGATSETVAGPWDTPLRYRPEPAMGGIVIYPEIKSGAATTGGVSDAADGWMQSTAGSFGGLGTPPCTVVRILNVAGNAITPWHDVIGVTTRAIANDSVVVWPPFSNEEMARFRNTDTFEYKGVYRVDVYSVALREEPLSGDLQEAAVLMGPSDYVPVTDNDAFSKHQFMFSPWARWLRNNRSFVRERAGVHVNERYLYSLLTSGAGHALGGGAEVARFVFDRTPEEDVLEIKLIFAAEMEAGGQLAIDFRVDSDDVAGGGAKTGREETFFDGAVSIQRFSDRWWGSVRPHQWPLAPTEDLSIYETPWFEHTPDAAAATQGTTLIVYAQSTPNRGAGHTACLRGVCVRGRRGNE